MPADDTPDDPAKAPRGRPRAGASPNDHGPDTASPAASANEIPTAPSSPSPPEPATTAHAEPVASAVAPLPPILARWRDAQLRTLLGEEAPATAEAFLAGHLLARIGGERTAGLRILSLGGARADSEIRFVEALRAQGVDRVSLRVVDRSVEGAAARRAAIEAAGLGGSIVVDVWTAGRLADLEPAHALLVCDALHGQAAAGDTLAALAAGLAPGGLLLFADRIAGGPVTLSPETAGKLAELWQVLPESLTSHAELAGAPTPGDDGGSPALGDDGLRALLERFAPVLTVGLGHVADLFVGPARGFVLSAMPEAAESLLASIDAIDESRSLVESLPPRHGLAVCQRREDGPADAEPEALGLPWAMRSR